jgi:ribosomal protein S18 acetylase RimI-like enzyme
VDYIPANFKGNPQHAFFSLLMIAVPYRQCGLGEQTVKWVEAEIKKANQVTTIFSAVQVNNPEALRFWQKNGYLIICGPELQTDTTVTYRLWKGI